MTVINVLLLYMSRNDYHRNISVAEAFAIGMPHLVEISITDKSYRGSGVYVLEFSDGVKIGMAKNICARRKAYESPWTKAVVEELYFKTRNPLKLETELKRRFRHYTREGSTEYFHQLKARQIKYYIEKLVGRDL